MLYCRALSHKMCLSHTFCEETSWYAGGISMRTCKLPEHVLHVE